MGLTHLRFPFENIFEVVAFSVIFEYTINESMACRSSRLEYGERVCLASASDEVLQSVEYRLLATLIQKIIDKNSKRIVDECQRYLDLYDQGIKPAYSTDIDYLIEQLNK